MSDYLDKFKGAVAGVFIGDTLGAPHEFRTSRPVREYTGLVQFETIVPSRFHAPKTIPLGGYTDDTEMTLTLMRSIQAYQGYSPRNVMCDYSRWATSGTIGIGTNTSDLFKKSKACSVDKRVQTYSTHYEKKFKTKPPYTADQVADVVKLDDGTFTQSNGSMMRCLPLVLFDMYDPVLIDCALTNPNRTNINVNMIYLDMIRLNLVGYSKQDVHNTILSRYSHLTDLINIYKQSIEEQLQVTRDVKNLKGWCLHAFYLAIKAYYFFETYQDAIDFVIRCGGDTDTNAVIAGALVGSYIGWQKMQAEQRTVYNYNIIMSTPKRPCYEIADWMELTEWLVANRHELKMI